MTVDLTAEQQAVRRLARDVAEREFRSRAAGWDEREEYPWANVTRLVELGLMGMTIPVEYGGAGRPVMDAILAVEQVGRVCGVTARILVEGNLGVVGALVRFGSEDQRRRYLPLVVKGEKPAIAITEPDAGSAAIEARTRAVRDGNGYRLTGTKCFITGAGISTVHLVLARFTEAPGAAGLGAVLVERGAEGFTVGRRVPMMGLRGIPEGELHFADCWVPEQNVLLPPPDGFKKLLSAYNGQRLGASTVALGLAQGALDAAVTYARDRRQFGRPIGEFQGLQWLLADMAIKLEAARLLIYRAAAAAGHGLPDPVETAMAKTFTAEAAIEVTNCALQIHGAYGYSREFPLERLARDARMFTIGGGTTQMMRNLIARNLLGDGRIRRADAG